MGAIKMPDENISDEKTLKMRFISLMDLRADEKKIVEEYLQHNSFGQLLAEYPLLGLSTVVENRILAIAELLKRGDGGRCR